jgi:hypothetical protein
MIKKEISSGSLSDPVPERGLHPCRYRECGQRMTESCLHGRETIIMILIHK